MLDAIPYRGDQTDTATAPGMALGYRWWGGRPGKSPGIHRAEDGALVVCAGTLAPPVPNPAADLDRRLRDGALSDLDGAFALARWDGRSLTVLRDPFGVRSLYFARLGDVLLFASELKQLLAVDAVPVEVDPSVVHTWLTFSFVPGKDTPIRGIRRLLAGRRMVAVPGGEPAFDNWFTLREVADPTLADPAEATREVRRTAKAAVRRRINGEPEVGLFLSGGLDSSAVAFWLKHAGQAVHALSLDFGAASVEREQAAQVAASLGIRHTWVPADGARVGDVLDELVHLLDLPFGDAVTGPQLLLAKAARGLGLSAVFNGEGGDQLFGGWTSKPMVASALYGGLHDEETTPEEEYLQAYHRFYGLEDQLYTREFSAVVGSAGRRRALLAPYLGDPSTSFYLNRVRLADLSLKGCQNILPRAERVANGCALDMRVPFFDRALAELSFRLPPSLKLHGACEKYVLKLALQGRLPDDIVWRRKFGMSVPITDWLLGPRGAPSGPLTARLRDELGADSVRRRGWFRPEYVAKLLAGEDAAGEVRRRRVGEKLWALWMLELWTRRFVDRRGR
jgi:asparagine synthase (glutamine-hydrolysing)